MVVHFQDISQKKLSTENTFAGSEDGSIKVWEAESGKTVQNLTRHQGWVTDLYFWQEAKLVVSASNDGLIITWSSSSIPHQVNSLTCLFK